VTLTGTAGALVRSTRIVLIVEPRPDFTLTVAPASATAVQGSATQAVLSIARTGTLPAIALSVTGLPAGATAVFSTNPAPGPTSQLAITTTTATPAGTYALAVTGTDGTVSRSTSFTLTVTAAPPPPPPPPAAGISLRLAQDTAKVSSGASFTVPVAIDRTPAFAGAQVNVTAVFGTSAGVAWAAPTPTTAPTTTLQVVVHPSATPGTYLLPVRGVASGTIVAPDTLVVQVTAAGAPDFALIPGNKAVFVVRGSPFVANTLTIQRTAGFSGVVTLESLGRPQNVLVDVAPASTGGTAATLSIYAAPNVPAGTYVVTIRGTSGTLIRDALLTLVLQ
jgi:hypothetical protein